MNSRTPIQRFIEDTTTNSLGYYQERNIPIQRSGLLNKFPLNMFHASDKVVKNTKYALKAHLGELEYRSCHSIFTSRTRLLKHAPQDYEFNYRNGAKTLSIKERRKERKQLLLSMRYHRRKIDSNYKRAQDQADWKAIRTGEGMSQESMHNFFEAISLGNSIEA